MFIFLKTIAQLLKIKSEVTFFQGGARFANKSDTGQQDGCVCARACVSGDTGPSFQYPCIEHCFSSFLALGHPPYYWNKSL